PNPGISPRSPRQGPQSPLAPLLPAPCPRRTWLNPLTARPSAHFLRAVRSLPPDFNRTSASEYAALLAAYGTHAVHSARLGGRVRALTNVQLCRAAMAGLGAQEASDCLRAEASFGGAGATAAACRTARATTEGNVSLAEFFGERVLEVDGGGDPGGDPAFGRPEEFSRWLKSVPAAPAALEADLWPLHALVPRGDPRRRALRAAVRSYVAAKALAVNCSCAPGMSGQSGGQSSGDLRDDLSDDPDDPSDDPADLSDPSAARPPRPAPPPPPLPLPLLPRPPPLGGSPCCPAHRGHAHASVLVLGGRGWRGDALTATDAYVRASFGGRGARTATAWNADRPRWGQRLDLGQVRLRPDARLELQVWDEDHGWDDDHLGTCREPLTAGVRPRLSCFPGGGRLDFAVTVTCGPSLAGPWCHLYVPAGPEGGAGVREGVAWPPDDDDDEDEETEEAEALHRFWEAPEGSAGEDGGNPESRRFSGSPQSEETPAKNPKNPRFGDDDDDDDEELGDAEFRRLWDLAGDDPKNPESGPFWGSQKPPKKPQKIPKKPENPQKIRQSFGDDDDDDEELDDAEFRRLWDLAADDPKNPESGPFWGSQKPPQNPRKIPQKPQKIRQSFGDDDDDDDDDEELDDAEFRRLWDLSGDDPKNPESGPFLGSQKPPKNPRKIPEKPEKSQKIRQSFGDDDDDDDDDEELDDAEFRRLWDLAADDPQKPRIRPVFGIPKTPQKPPKIPKTPKNPPKIPEPPQFWRR
ncbi:LOW QUALITY PROTEIN: uncharacterized protein, partial [Chamaea fasciata]|uniref:LOW QUALITY PROTEIN: uncharacterized protein n=1 Tax=Chamaea fasciata TaxID=190680 RepID=UPI00336A33E9